MCVCVCVCLCVCVCVCVCVWARERANERERQRVSVCQLLHCKLSAVHLLTPTRVSFGFRLVLQSTACRLYVELWVAVGGKGRGRSQGVQFV